MTMAGRRRVARVRVGRLRHGRFATRGDSVAVEEPLEIRLEVPDGAAVRERPVSVTMRTPGDDFELAAGFLFTEGVVNDPAAVSGGEVLPFGRAPGVQCGDRVAQRSRCVRPFQPGPQLLCHLLLRRVRQGLARGGGGHGVPAGCGGNPLHRRGGRAGAAGEAARGSTGVRPHRGIHAAGLFDATGRITVVREDVGRHNAVDKVVGVLVLSRALPGSDLGLVVSGRSSFEILQKAAMAGFPMVVAVGAPSSLAVAFARRFGVTLVGFANREGYNIYAGPERITGLPRAAAV